MEASENYSKAKMEEIIKIIIGAIVLTLGIPLGNFLAKSTKEELKPGKKYFKAIITLSLLGGIFGLIIQNDILMFSLFFMAIVTSRSIKN